MTQVTDAVPVRLKKVLKKEAFEYYRKYRCSGVGGTKRGRQKGSTEAKEHQREGERMENRRKKEGRSFVVVRFHCV